VASESPTVPLGAAAPADALDGGRFEFTNVSVADVDSGRSDIPPVAIIEGRSAPAWVPRSFRGRPLYGGVVQEDGSTIASYDHAIVTFTNERVADAAIEPSELRGDLVKRVPLCCDHSVVDRGTVLRHPVRVGDVLFATGSDMAYDDMDFLIAIDLKDGAVLWKTARYVAPEGFVVRSGHAIASGREGARNVVRVIDLETGAISSKLETKLGPYPLRYEAGELRGSRLPSTHVPPSGTIVITLD
jgi:hypothetical protein